MYLSGACKGLLNVVKIFKHIVKVLKYSTTLLFNDFNFV